MESLTNQTAAPDENAIASPEIDENPFNRLQDELIISQIFDRILDVKCLFMCSLVSKHFASLILRTHKVSFIIPFITESPSPSLAQKFLSLLSAPYNFLKQLINPTKKPKKPSFPLGEDFLPCMFSGFLGKLRSVHYLNGEFSFPRNLEILEEDTWFKWLFDYKYPSSWSVIILTARSLTAATATDIDEEDDNSTNEDATNFHEALLDSLSHFVSHDLHLRCCLLGTVVRSLGYFPELKLVVISDSSKQGKLVAREKKLVAMRTQDENPNDIIGCVKVWNEAVVRLPISDCVMKDAKLIVMKFKLDGEEELIAEPENDIFDFEDEEDMESFVEAVTQMMMMKNADFEKAFILERNSPEAFPTFLV